MSGQLPSQFQQPVYYQQQGQPPHPPSLPSHPSQLSQHPHPHLPPPHYNPAQEGMYPGPSTSYMPRGPRHMEWSHSSSEMSGGFPSSSSRVTSGGVDGYPAYPQPGHGQHRTPPSRQAAGQGHSGGAWSSMHPGSGLDGHHLPSTAGSRPGSSASAGRPIVKLEDLVSSERTSSRPVSSHLKSSGSLQHLHMMAGPGGMTSLPLSTTHSSDQLRSDMDDDGGDGGGGGGRGRGKSGKGDKGDKAERGGTNQSGPSEFIKKLYKMLEEETVQYGQGRPPGAPRPEGAGRGPVGWGKGGTSFVVWDMNSFTTQVLPQTFRHSNFSSFVRQLNKYGFSKIKHVDEETGTIRENVWQFQHPNFVAGGKSDLESIKRKVVMTKKVGTTGEADNEGSPRVYAEEPGRISEMESRVSGLEDQLSKALDEVRDVRNREMGMLNLMREMIGHIAKTAKGNSPSDSEPSPEVVHLYQSFDQVASGTGSSFFMPAKLSQQSSRSSGPKSRNASARFPHPSTGSASFPGHPSPHGTDNGSRNGDGPSPAGSRFSAQQNDDSADVAATTATTQQSSAIETPTATATTAQGGQTLFNGEPLEMTPMFADTPAWLTEGTNAPIAMYHRKASENTAMKIMMEALGSAPTATDVNTSNVRFGDAAQEALDPSRKDASIAASVFGGVPVQMAQTTTTNVNGSTMNGLSTGTVPVNPSVAAAAGIGATVQQSPFGTLVIPPTSALAAEQQPVASTSTASGSRAGNSNSTTVRLRRNPTVKSHWTQTPRILVVEDDVVYRQLSSKFLEKFGCVTETVEDAQGAVEKMNRTRYDLVLMDIFFGPNMDGRKATSLIRQFDMYTPIISMTSNVQTQDVNSYLQSGMNDVLAKPFTKHGLFGILDKHLIHLKAIQLSAQVPRSLGVPPLSDQGIADAVAIGAAQWGGGANTGVTDEVALRNPLAAMGWSDETYGIVLQQFISTGSMPDATVLTNGAIGTSIVFGDSSGFNRKRSIETLDEGWTPPGSSNVNVNGVAGNNGVASIVPIMPDDSLIGGLNGNGGNPASKRLKSG